MISVAKACHRAASLLKVGLAAIVVSGMIAGCTERPKIDRAADSQSSSVEEAPAPPPPPAPSPQVTSPAEPSSGSTLSEAEQQLREAKEEDAKKQESVEGSMKAARAPSAEAPVAENPAGGAAPPQPAPEVPGPLGEAPVPAKPSVDAAPRTEDTAVPASVGSGAPPPPPPPAAAMPPPAAPAIAARAAVETDPNKKYKVVPVYYGTDRAVQPDPTRLQFGSERGHKLQLGRALITVPFSHEVPHIERPRVVEIPYFKIKVYSEKEDPDKHFTVQEITSLTEDQMLALVKAQLAKSKTFKDHALVFVHGFNTSFDCALYRTAQVAYDLGFDGVPFVYSWPSGGNVASYTYDHGSVEQAEPMLAEFLDMVIQKSGAKSISLIAHSMGNELLLRVLERLRPRIPRGVVISQVILAAPDVDRDKFNIIAREITNFAKGVTLYAASNDRALGYSERFWGGIPRAGDIPKDGPLIIPGVDTIDVTAVSTDALGLNHSGYAENPALLSDVKALVEYGIRPPNKRLSSIVAVESQGGTFWRFEGSN